MSWFRQNEEDARKEASGHYESAADHTAQAEQKEDEADRFQNANWYLDDRWRRSGDFTGDPSKWFKGSK